MHSIKLTNRLMGRNVGILAQAKHWSDASEVLRRIKMGKNIITRKELRFKI